MASPVVSLSCTFGNEAAFNSRWLLKLWCKIFNFYRPYLKAAGV